jgi:hypothetical protein
MPDPITAPQAGADGAALPEQVTVTDEHSAADAIARSGLLDGIIDAAEAPATDSGDEPGDAPGETPASGEEEGQSEPPASAQTAIEPPKSWSDEHKAIFGKLPPEAQSVIAQRESERDRAFTQKAEEVANERKATEAERAAIQSRTAQYTDALKQLAAVVMPEVQALQSVDWGKLAQDNPAEFVRLQGVERQARGRLDAINAEYQRANEAQQQEMQKRHGEFLAAQQKLLAERIPEFADPEKGKAIAGELGQFLQSRGFTGAEIGNIADHRAVAMAVELMRFQKAEATRKAAEAKTAAQTAPRVQKPGTPADSCDAVSQRVKNDIGRFQQTGNIKDAARLLEHAIFS